jgi:hypothetical protein
MSVVESIAEPSLPVEALRQRGHGVIETADERLAAVRLRRLPKMVSLPEALWLGRVVHARRRGNRCLLYYNQPRSCPNYLALKYVVSQRDTTLATFRLALVVLDRIAAIKCSDAIVADVTNLRISDRLLRRWGWEPHLAGGWHRHWIKRFYGNYPTTHA